MSPIVFIVTIIVVLVLIIVGVVIKVEKNPVTPFSRMADFSELINKTKRRSEFNKLNHIVPISSQIMQRIMTYQLTLWNLNNKS